MVKWVDIIKEKSQIVQSVNTDLIKRWEPQVKEIKDSLQNSLRNSTIVTSFSTYNWFSNETQSFLEQVSPEAKTYFETLHAQLGQELCLSEAKTLSQEQINAFADISNDHQWIHVDPERAKKESPYRGTVAHGLFMLALIPGLRKIEQDSLYQGGRFIVNAGFGQVDFLSPLKPGQAFRLRAELDSVSLGKRHVDIQEKIQLESACGKRVICKTAAKFKLYV